MSLKLPASWADFIPNYLSGQVLGSFNSWIRLLSGLAFGIACVWLTFPYIDCSIQATEQRINERYARLAELEQTLAAKMDVYRR
jgi:hypothetical protein